MSFLLKYRICEVVSKGSRGAGQAVEGSVKKREGEECGTRVLNAGEKMRKARWGPTCPMTTLKMYKGRERNSEKKLEVEELTGWQCCES